MAEFWDDKKHEPTPQRSPLDAFPAGTPHRSVTPRGIPFGSGLGKYRILDRIRTLQHAIVYNARDAMLDRLVVIKQLNPGLLDDPLACGDFKREAQLLARVPKDARNVIGIHELIGDDQGLFIVEEFVAGDWLEVLIAKRKAGLADALRLLKYGCLGLRSLHSRKIVHRDIQPSSLLISPNGQVRIANFSCATHEGDHTPPPTISTKYAAPEIQLGMPHDDRVDIYSLGMTVYEVCVGRRALHAHFAPITRDPVAAVERWRQWHGDMSLILPNANALNPSVPPALAAILHRMTIKDVDERLASAEEVLQEIIRRFSGARSNAAPSIAGATKARLVDAGPAFAGPQPGSTHPEASRSTPSLLHLIQPNKSTITEQVQVGPGAAPSRATAAAVAPIASRDQVGLSETKTVAAPIEAGDAAPPEPVAKSVPRPALRRASSASRPRNVAAVIRPIVASQQVPEPAPAVDLARRRRPLLLPIAAALMLAFGFYLAGNYWWEHHSGRPEQQSVNSITDAGLKLYEAQSYRKAREKFLQASVMSQSDESLIAERNRAETLLLVTDGQIALEKDQFKKVEELIHDAGLRGAEPAALTALRTKYMARRDAMKLVAEGATAAQAGRFADVEVKLPEYEEKAKLSGLDPASLKERLKREREDRDIDEALLRARKALADNDFDSAMLACRDAQDIRVTTATRQLRQDIADAKSRYDWMVRGDKAMTDHDYAAAESAYQSANAVDPTEDVEQRLRVASAMRLYDEARQLIAAGELLEAKKKLESSLWKYQTRRARSKLLGLAKAFDAAQLVVNADREMEKGNPDQAVRLYEKAIPDLISPADEFAKAKLQTARQAASQPSREN